MAIKSVAQSGLSGFTKYRSLADASGNPKYYPPSFDFITSSTFSGVSSVSIDNCFSADYDHYLIMRDAVATVRNGFRIRLRSSGSDDSTNSRYQLLQANGTSVAGLRGTSQTYFGYGLGTAQTVAGDHSHTFISNPYRTVQTTAWNNSSDLHNGNIILSSFVFAHDSTSSFDGFTASVSSGTVSGTIYVYGWKV